MPNDGIDSGIQHDGDAATVRSGPDIGQVRGVRLCLEEAAACRVVGVLDVAPDGTCFEEGIHKIIRGQVVAGLEVRRDRHVHGRCDLTQLSECGLPIAVVVRATAGGRHCHAGCCDDRAPGRNDGPGASHVPKCSRAGAAGRFDEAHAGAGPLRRGGWLRTWL